MPLITHADHRSTDLLGELGLDMLPWCILGKGDDGVEATDASEAQEDIILTVPRLAFHPPYALRDPLGILRDEL